MRHALLAATAIYILAAQSLAQAQSTASTSPSTAASANEEFLQEVVVTAQKRVENVQDVPVAVTVVDSSELTRRGTQSLTDLSLISGSLEIGNGIGGGGFVRGIGTTSTGSQSTAQPSVSMVLDGVVLGTANVTDLFDLQRVEVLKGPQGTLFGSSVSSGVINITTNAPVIGESNGYVSLEYADSSVGSEYDRGSLRTAVNLPINDTSALRIADFAYNIHGLLNDVYNGTKSNTTDYGIRLRYLNHLTDKLTLNLIADYAKTISENAQTLIYAHVDAAPLQQALAACGVTPSLTNRTDCDSFPLDVESKVAGASAQFDYDFRGMTGTSITSYRYLPSYSVTDITSIPPDIAQQYLGGGCHFSNCNPIVFINGIGPPQTNSRSLFTEELRLASPANHQLEWVAGAYFQESTYHYQALTTLEVNLHHGAPPNSILSQNWVHDYSDAHDYAVFGNVTYYLGQGTRLVGGARYTHSDVAEQSTYQLLAPAVSSITEYASTDAQALTWRAAVQHDFTTDTMAYLIAATGFKAPQINDNITVQPIYAVLAERPISFELGVKQSLLDRRFYVDADLFYERVTDFQTTSCVPSPLIGIACANINVPRVNSKGAELEVFGRLFPGNSSEVSAAYVRATYPPGFHGADNSLMSGQQLIYSPEFKVTFSTEQDFPLSEHYTGVIGGDLTYRTSQAMYLSGLPQYLVPATTLINVRAGVRRNRWSVFLFSRNVGNEFYPTSFSPSTAFAPGYWHGVGPNSVRTSGLQFEGNF